jgi:hypothetical protein
LQKSRRKWQRTGVYKNKGDINVNIRHVISEKVMMVLLREIY